jgi:hypothetical protein
MLFLTYWSLVFAAVTLLLLWVTRWPQLRLVLLVLSGAVFHAHFAGPAGVLPIVGLAMLTYLVALTRDRRLCRLGIVACALGLVFCDRRRITFDVDGRAVAGDAPGAWEEIRRDLEAGRPAAVRRRTLVIVVPPSPYYVERLTAEDRRRFDELLHGSASVLEEAGYEAVVEGDEFTADDFADMLHLTPSGGAKLADLVPPRVAAMAEQLGYLR